MKKQNGNQPVTQHDLSLFAGEFTRRMDQQDDRLDRLENIVGRVLDIVQSLDERFKLFEDHEDRLTRMEKRVFALEQKWVK